MDYADGKEIPHMDWKQMHRPGINLYLGQEAESGEITRRDFSEAIRKIKEGIQHRNKDVLKNLDHLGDDNNAERIQLTGSIKLAFQKFGKISSTEINQVTILNRINTEKSYEIDFKNLELKPRRLKVNNIEYFSLDATNNNVTFFSILFKGKKAFQNRNQTYNFIYQNNTHPLRQRRQRGDSDG